MLMKTCYHNKSIRNIGNIRDLFILISAPVFCHPSGTLRPVGGTPYTPPPPKPVDRALAASSCKIRDKWRLIAVITSVA